MSEPILAPTFLFRFAVPLHRYDGGWTHKGIDLDEAYRLPSFGELEQRSIFADLRAGWSEAGLFFSLRVAGKRQPPWCRETRIEDSDGLQVWIDTRDTHTIHRAGRFCHRFVLMPSGAGRKLADPAARLLPINRARENPKPVAGDKLSIRSEQRVDGYLLEAHLPAEALTGYDPAEHPRLGFTCAVVDRELGWQTFSIGPEFPFQEDPSLWGTLELREAQAGR
jgi:hypothetical protein